jgi:Zn-dependent protease
MEAIVSAMYAFVKVFLMIPSLLMDGIYKLGPVVAPILALALSAAFAFYALGDKTKDH